MRPRCAGPLYFRRAEVPGRAPVRRASDARASGMSLKLRNSRRGLSYGVGEGNLTFPSRPARTAFSLSTDARSYLSFVASAAIDLHRLRQEITQRSSRVFHRILLQKYTILVCKLAHVADLASPCSDFTAAGKREEQRGRERESKSFDMMKAGSERSVWVFTYRDLFFSDTPWPRGLIDS